MGVGCHHQPHEHLLVTRASVARTRPALSCPMPALMPVSLLSPLGPARPSQFFTCLVILFACEVAAGIWGFVNKDQVSLDGRGPVPAGLGLGRACCSVVGNGLGLPLDCRVLFGAARGPCLTERPWRVSGGGGPGGRGEGGAAYLPAPGGVGVGQPGLPWEHHFLRRARRTCAPPPGGGPCGGCDLTASAHPTPRSPRT